MSAIAKIEYEKLPKIGSNRDNTEKSIDCVVPIIENKNEKFKDDALKKFNACIPDDLILSLKQAEQPKEYIGPPSKKTLNGIKPSNPTVIRRPDNAWNFEKQREKFKFLIDQPVCSCGAGKDVSFLYDSVTQVKQIQKPNPSKYDISAIRASDSSQTESSIQVHNTLIPEEYKIVKNQGVWPLRVDENNFTAVTEEHLNHVTMFPSLKPTGRNEVIQLKHTMDALLKRVGADVIDQKGPTQLHNLLEIIKQEQDIYNIVFHEVIRQVTVECKDRGEILSKLRERYANLLARVPREIKSLHEEIIAQRALDRRLTEELMQFKATINYLTDELSYVREHDKKIAEQANIYQKDLQKALQEAEKNASLLSEYHELYELQRKRLEGSIQVLIEERDLWIKTCYCVAFKVAHENKLNTAKRLNIAEKSWSKLGKHLALLLSDRDTKDLIEIQKLIENWKSLMDEVREEVILKENDLKKSLDITRKDLADFKKFLKSNSYDDSGNLVTVPDLQKLIHLNAYIKKILEMTGKESDNFNGDSTITNEEKLKKCERILFQFMQLCSKVTSRQEASKDKTRYEDFMRYEVLQSEIKLLHEQYRNRASGDNGISKNLTSFNNGLDVWQQKISSQMLTDNSKSKLKISEAEWAIFYQSLDELNDFIVKAQQSIGNPMKEFHDIAPASDDDNKVVDHDLLINRLHKWMSSYSLYVDSQDSFLADQVNNLHSKMIHWMVQALIRLAPDKEELSEEAKKMVYDSTATVENLEKISVTLVEKLEKFTNNLANRCHNIIVDDENNRKVNEESKFAKENLNITNFQNDFKEWSYTIKLMNAELHGDKAHRKLLGDRLGQKNASDIREKSNLEVLNEDENEEEQETEHKHKEETIEPHHEPEYVPNEPEEEKEPKKEEPKVTFEIINKDTNTEYKFLENLTLEDSNHLSEEELKSTVFNAYKTIESLQNDLITTEERAQRSEERVAELEFKLKEALEKIRAFENK